MHVTKYICFISLCLGRRQNGFVILFWEMVVYIQIFKVIGLFNMKTAPKVFLTFSNKAKKYLCIMFVCLSVRLCILELS